ncbi:MAG: site-specific integrase [Porticoccaceae bacterium]|nr:site-specific integrase [Porticoccaceae bacterium]
MRKHSPDNERIKRKYFIFLKEAKRQNEASIDAVASALSRFEEYMKWRDFKTFHFEQAVAFKKHLAGQKNQKTGKPLSKATLYSTLRHLKGFFQWLAMQPNYKSRINYTDAEYFNLSEKDARVATARREKPVPTIEQIKHVIDLMPSGTAIKKRNRAIVAFTLLTGARDNAIVSIKLKHVDLMADSIFQDAREVKTKYSKTFTSYFFPVGDDIRGIVYEWVAYLRDELLWGNDDPLFPKTSVVVNDNRVFEASGLMKEHWASAAPIRKIFREAFEAADLPYFNPHSFRSTLVMLGENLCRSPEEFKAWSQNLGHEGVLTTFYSYGEVQGSRQGEIFKELKTPREPVGQNVGEIAKAVVREMRNQNT